MLIAPSRREILAPLGAKPIACSWRRPNTSRSYGAQRQLRRYQAINISPYQGEAVGTATRAHQGPLSTIYGSLFTIHDSRAQ